MSSGGMNWAGGPPPLRPAFSTKRVVEDKVDVPNANPVAAICFLNGVFLAVCGYHGAASHGFEPKAMHSLYAGVGGGAMLAAMGLISVSGFRRLYMIGVHVALLLQVLFILVFALQAYRSYGVPEKADRYSLFCLMCGGTFLSLIGMRLFKPKKKKEL